MDRWTVGRMTDGLVDVWMDGWTDGLRRGRTDVDGIKDEEGNGRMVCRRYFG